VAYVILTRGCRVPDDTPQKPLCFDDVTQRVWFSHLTSGGVSVTIRLLCQRAALVACNYTTKWQQKLFKTLKKNWRETYRLPLPFCCSPQKLRNTKLLKKLYL